MGIRSLLQGLLGRSAPGPAKPAEPFDASTPDLGDLGETKTIEETIDEVKDKQTPETGRGLP